LFGLPPLCKGADDEIHYLDFPSGFRVEIGRAYNHGKRLGISDDRRYVLYGMWRAYFPTYTAATRDEPEYHDVEAVCDCSTLTECAMTVHYLIGLEGLRQIREQESLHRAINEKH
jgi:hypothetical protein